MEQIQNKVIELRKLILESEEYKKVKELEEKLLEDEVSLIIDFNKKQDEYNDSIKHGYYNETYLINLSKSKEKLYTSEGCKNYFNALKEMNDMLHEISEIMFDDIVPDLKIK